MGNYQLIGNLLIKKNNDETRTFYAISYLDGIKELYDNTKLLTYNGQLWGMISYYKLGKLVLVEKAITSDKEVTEYYVCIIPTYRVPIYEYDNDIEILSGKTRLPKEFFYIETVKSSLLCKKIYYSNIYTIASSKIRQLADSYNVFFDVFSKKWIILDKDNLTLLDENKSFNCKGIKQWITPSSKIETLTSNAIIYASENNDILVTYPNSGFYRELLKNKQISLTPYVYNGCRLSLGITGTDKIGVNKISSNRNNLQLDELPIKKVIIFEFLSQFEKENENENEDDFYSFNGNEGLYISWEDMPEGDYYIGYYFYLIFDTNDNMYTRGMTFSSYNKGIEEIAKMRADLGVPIRIYYDCDIVKYKNAHRIYLITYYDKKDSKFVTRTITYDKVMLSQSENDNEENEDENVKQVEIRTNDDIVIYIDMPDYVNTYNL